MDRRATAALLLALYALAPPAFGADLSLPHHRARREARSAAVRRPSPRIVVVAPVAVRGMPEVGAARPPLPSPTAVLLPGAAGLPASIDLSPVFLPQRACGPGFSPDAIQSCRRHGELRVDCDARGRNCIPLPPDPLPYGAGAAARLAY